MTITVNGHLI